MAITLVIPLPQPLRKILQRLCCGLANVTWIEETDLNLELIKLENKHLGRVDAMIEQLKEIDIPPFTILLKGVETHPAKKGHGAIWVGVETNNSLTALTKTLTKHLSLLNISTLSTTPHVFLGHYQILSSERLAHYLEGVSLFTSSSFLASSFDLLSSHATDKRMVSTLLHRFPLRS